MTKLTRAVLILVVVPVTAQAQKFMLGARLGGSSATQHHGEPADRYQSVKGMVGGVAAGLEVTRWLTVQAEALYTRKGARDNGWYEIRMDYLEAPVLVRLSWPASVGNVRPFVAGGLAPSVELACSGYSIVAFPDGWRAVALPPGTAALDCDGRRQRRTDRGEVIGAGASYDRGRHQFTLELRRTRGRDIAAYDCCTLRNDVTSLVVGVSRRMH